MKYTTTLIDIRLDQALELYNKGKWEQGEAYATLAIAMMMRNEYKEPVILTMNSEQIGS